ncbi:MAG: MerR family DNA-binding protein [Gammaproteobacteria bacterium]
MIVKELAEKARVSTHLVRFYSRVGLLDPARDHQNGYKLFENSHVNRVEFVRTAQSLGLKLKEIRALIEAQDRGSPACCHRVTEIVRERLADTRKKIEDLTTLAGRLEAVLLEWQEVDGCEPLRSGVICPKIIASDSGAQTGDLATQLELHPRVKARTQARTMEGCLP